MKKEIGRKSGKPWIIKEDFPGKIRKNNKLPRSWHTGSDASLFRCLQQNPISREWSAQEDSIYLFLDYISSLFCFLCNYIALHPASLFILKVRFLENWIISLLEVFSIIASIIPFVFLLLSSATFYIINTFFMEADGGRWSLARRSLPSESITAATKQKQYTTITA